MPERKNSHTGHKARMRERFIKTTDFNAFSEHEILEMLLGYCVIRKNTNEIAHNLIKRFGSLNDTLKASIKELCMVEGIGERAAVFLKMQYSLLRYYNSVEVPSLAVNLDLRGDALNRLMPLFARLGIEKMYMAAISNAGKIKWVDEVATGTSTTIMITPKDIVAKCLADGSIAAVAIAHNHPGGRVYPSQEDINFTKLLKDALQLMEIGFVEHYIIGENNYYPILKNNILLGSDSRPIKTSHH